MLGPWGSGTQPHCPHLLTVAVSRVRGGAIPGGNRSRRQPRGSRHGASVDPNGPRYARAVPWEKPASPPAFQQRKWTEQHQVHLRTRPNTDRVPRGSDVGECCGSERSSCVCAWCLRPSVICHLTSTAIIVSELHQKVIAFRTDRAPQCHLHCPVHFGNRRETWGGEELVEGRRAGWCTGREDTLPPVPVT